MNLFLEQFTKAWDSLTIRQRVSLFISAGMTVVAILAVVWWARLPTWAPLHAGVDLRSVNTVLQELETNSIPVDTRDGGRTILVPVERVDEARRLLADSGLTPGRGKDPDSMVGSTSPGESTRTIEWRMKRSLELRLAATLEEFTWIRHARVHLTMPGGSPFIDDRDIAKASVQVTALPGFYPTSAQAQGVVNTVRDAVPELVQENISVTDQTGRPIVDGQAEAAGGGVGAGRQLEIKNAVERDINQKIASVLGPIVGLNGFAIRTDATLDHQKIARHKKTFDPDGSVVAKETKQKDKETSGRTGAGAPGTASNLPGAGGARGGGNASSRQTSSQTNEFLTSYEETTIDEPSGTIDRLSVSVVINQKSEIPEGEQEAIASVRTPEELQNLERLVKAAMGFDEERGDLLVLHEQPFQQPTVIETTEPFDPITYLPLVKWPALIILLLVAFFLFYRPTLRTVQGLLDVGKRDTGGGEASAELNQQLQIGPPSRIELMRQRLAKLAAEEPEGLAQTMRVWLNEEAE